MQLELVPNNTIHYNIKETVPHIWDDGKSIFTFEPSEAENYLAEERKIDVEERKLD